MKYIVPLVFGALVLFGFIGLAGAGHGWIAGAFSCLALAPISFAAWFNAFRTKPSPTVANGLLVGAGLVLVATALATVSEGTHYFVRVWRQLGIEGACVAALIYFNWVFACGLTWWRYRAGTSSFRGPGRR